MQIPLAATLKVMYNTQVLVTEPALVVQFASLRRSVETDAAGAWLPEAIHALIVACLVRLLARLEDIIQLWSQGLLPPLPASTPRIPRPPTSRASAPRTSARAVHPRARTAGAVSMLRVIRAPDSAPAEMCPRMRASLIAASHPGPRNARAPPVVFRPPRRENLALRGRSTQVLIVLIRE